MAAYAIYGLSSSLADYLSSADDLAAKNAQLASSFIDVVEARERFQSKLRRDPIDTLDEYNKGVEEQKNSVKDMLESAGNTNDLRDALTTIKRIRQLMNEEGVATKTKPLSAYDTEGLGKRLKEAQEKFPELAYMDAKTVTDMKDDAFKAWSDEREKELQERRRQQEELTNEVQERQKALDAVSPEMKERMTVLDEIQKKYKGIGGIENKIRLDQMTGLERQKVVEEQLAKDALEVLKKKESSAEDLVKAEQDYLEHTQRAVQIDKEITQEKEEQKELEDFRKDALRDILDKSKDELQVIKEANKERERAIEQEKKRLEKLKEAASKQAESFGDKKFDFARDFNKSFTSKQAEFAKQMDRMQNPIYDMLGPDGMMRKMRDQQIDSYFAQLEQARDQFLVRQRQKMLQEKAQLEGAQAQGSGKSEDFERQRNTLEKLQELEMQQAQNATNPMQAQQHLQNAQKLQEQIQRSYEDEQAMAEQRKADMQKEIQDVTDLTNRIDLLAQTVRGMPPVDPVQQEALDKATKMADELMRAAQNAMMLNQMGGGGGAGGVAGGIGGFLGGLAGGGFGGGLGGFGGFFAGGGAVDPNHWHIVGERGPELFVPGSAGSILSNSDTERLFAAIQPSPGPASGGGGTSRTVGGSSSVVNNTTQSQRFGNVSINLNGTGGPDQSAMKIRWALEASRIRRGR